MQFLNLLAQSKPAGLACLWNQSINSSYDEFT